MRNYRNLNSDYRNLEDPLRPDRRNDRDARSARAAWGWIAGAIFLVIVLASAFVSYEPFQAPPCGAFCSMSRTG